MRDFCHSSRPPSEPKKWERLLRRASAVVSRCCEKARLPVDGDASPLRFLVPESGAEEEGKRNSE